jgi:hypothetical protein
MRNQGLLADPRWQLVERIIASPHLAKSGRLCSFLQYVCEEALLGRGDQLNEQKIGVHVYERKADYDSAEDNIVRSHASRLRQRLEAYFLIEGQNETLRLTLPRGGYIPQFTTVAASLGDPLASPRTNVRPSSLSSEVEVAKREGRGGRINRILAAALIVTTATAAWEWNAHRLMLQRTKSSSPVMRAFWGELFAPGKRTLVVPADSSLVLYENLTTTTVPLQSYMDKSYLAGQAASTSQTPDDIARRVGHRRLTSVADIELTSKLLGIPEAIASPPTIRFARDLQVADLKGANGVLIGAKESNPWLSMFEARRNFVIDDDQQTRVFTVVNHAPRPGELPVYRSQPDDSNHMAYALIALVPNLDNSGMVLIVEGTSIAGTEAAADFLTGNPSQIEQVLVPVYQQYGRVPPFEVLLETTNLNGSAPQSHVLAVRVTP